jgi:hypothetical protein
MIRTAFDVQLDALQVQINVPKVKGGDLNWSKCPCRIQCRYPERLSDCYEQYEDPIINGTFMGADHPMQFWCSRIDRPAFGGPLCAG